MTIVGSGLFRRVVVGVVLVLSTVPLSHLHGQPSQPNSTIEFDRVKIVEFERMLDRLHNERKFSGTVLVAQNGKTILEKSVGFSNPHENKRLQSNSSFRLASVSKQFVAMGIMLLAEQGKLRYDDDIKKHLPELPYEGVTIRHLLNHTGGLPDYISFFAKHWDVGKRLNDRKMAFNKDLVGLFAKHKPPAEFQPGEKWMYSNTGYVILGTIIEQVSGQPVQQFMQERIFAPLEMNDSRAFVGGDEFQLDDRAYGFRFGRQSGFRERDWHPLNGMVGDGGVYASARDLVKWDAALYGEKLVKQSTLDAAFTPAKLNDGTETAYGFGWWVETTKQGGLRVSHGGAWVGFRTYIERELDYKLLAIVLTNNTCKEFPNIVRGLRKLREEAGKNSIQ